MSNENTRGEHHTKYLLQDVPKSTQKSSKMSQNQLNNLINEIYGHAFSLKEDVEHGLRVNHNIIVSNEEERELNQISDKLMSLSEKIGMQFIIQDFE